MKVFYREATIPSGSSLSNTVDLGEEYNPGVYKVLAIQMPDEWTTARITFSVSYDGETFVPLYWNGDLYEIDASGGSSASRGISVEPSAFAGWPYVKIRSGKKSAEIQQAGERQLKVLIGNV